MDNFNWLMQELLWEQRERLFAAQTPRHYPDEAHQDRGGLRRALASGFVRLGLRLDPAAGEGLGPFELSLARHEARRSS